jgi:SAM-dependent methyltransferase
MAGPFDWLARRLNGRGDLPPLWLRRHAGPVGKLESSARDSAALIDRLGLVREGARLVDLGCGCGAMVPALVERIGERGGYVGVDVHAPSLSWCRRRWRRDPRVRFEPVTMRSRYGGGDEDSVEAPLPVADGAADLVLAKSLFTHLLAGEARHYLREIRRMVAPDGAALVTAFLFDGERFAASPPPAFPHPRVGSPVRWRRALRPTAAVAYERRSFLDSIADAGLTVAEEIHGFFPGEAAVPSGQDVLLLHPLRRSGCPGER